MDSKRLWHEPTTSTIYLSNGLIVHTEINGRSLDDNTAYVFVGDREIAVELVDGDWYEQS